MCGRGWLLPGSGLAAIEAGGDEPPAPPSSFSARPAIGVSGGADSLCLVWLARLWADPLALIVDHGLRAQSATEAAQTAARLGTLGIPSRILRLTGLTHGPGLAARARAARYAALIAATRAAGRVELWLGHHARDQAETWLMRRDAHSGAAGLAGMAALREMRDVRILRPLLDTPPDALRAILRRAGLSWIEDPTNQDPATLRGRLRATLDDQTMRRMAAAARQGGEARAGRERELAAELAARAAIFPQGYAQLTPGPIAADALGALIRGLSGAAYAPHGRGLARLAASPGPAVLGGIRLMAAGRLGAGLLLVREAAALAAAIPARAGALWDRRFLIDAVDTPDGMIGAVGEDAPGLRSCTKLPDAVLRSLPALRVHGVLVEVPHIGYRSRDGSARMAVSFAPANPACGAPFGVDMGRGCQRQTATPSA